MKKKISVISLILLFSVSTIGLPITINFCMMMDTPLSVSCEMNSECQNESHSNSSTSEFVKADCCKTEIIDKAISDNYLQPDIQINSLNHNIVAVINPNLEENNNSIIDPVHYFNDTSPPALSNNHIYLSISILLI